MNAAVGGAGACSDHSPGLGRQAIDPITGEDRLTGLLIGPKAGPVALGFISFVRDRSFDDQDKGGQVSCNGAVKWLEEVFTVCVSEHRVVKIPFGNPGDSAEENILQAWLRCRGHGNCVAITAEACGNPKHIYLGKGWCVLLWIGAGHSDNSRVCGL